MSALVAAAPDRLSAAYAHCERLASAHYENFPVASLLLPARMRAHVAAIYAFARTADDFADQPGRPPAERLRLLDQWHEKLLEAGRTDCEDPVFCALGHTMRVHDLPLALFEDLLSAFRQDVTTTRYATWGDVLDYCRRSANPVGRLVLRVAGYSDPRLDEQSDAVCTALQLANFWQDLAIDWRNGRLYVPAEERDRAGAREADLDAGRVTPEWKSAIHAACERTRDLFTLGRPVCDAVSGRLRWELRVTWLGGSRILDRLEATNYEVFQQRPKLRASDAPALLWAALRWRDRRRTTDD